VKAAPTSAEEEAKEVEATNTTGAANAASLQVEVEVEKRIDPTDGNAYTHLEFVSVYGEPSQEWESAEIVVNNKADLNAGAGGGAGGATAAAGAAATGAPKAQPKSAEEKAAEAEAAAKKQEAEEKAQAKERTAQRGKFMIELK
jgi:hypothetical protein